jgi:hypothetical protein
MPLKTNLPFAPLGHGFAAGGSRGLLRVDGGGRGFPTGQAWKKRKKNMEPTGFRFNGLMTVKARI